MDRNTTVLRKLIHSKETITAPAVYDCMSAKIAERVGFKAVFVSGFCLNIADKGLPDIGTETRTDMVCLAKKIANSIDIPVIVDAADGYGGSVGIYRTIRELEGAGAAGCFIEDQTSPPICPVLGPPEVIPKDKFLQKIKCAAAARKDKDFVIIARTDAAATRGVQEAITRANESVEAGADMILPGGGAPKDKEGLGKFIESVDAPVMVPPAFDLGLTLKDYEQMGAAIVSGLEILLACADATHKVLSELKNTGFVTDTSCHFTAIPNLGDLLGWGKWFDIEKKFNA